MSSRLRSALAFLAAAALAATAHAAEISGVVLDHRGQPVEFASVRVTAQKLGGATDEQGRFSLTIPDGPAMLEISQLGYQRAHVPLLVADGARPLRIVLADEPVPVAEVTVAASSFGRTGGSEGAVVRRDDVYMTPGGAADIFQSLRALPGISAPAEGAALYVRGGAPNETSIHIDGADIGHPYHYEGASGGLFSILDTYMLKSAFFSSGGFGARYGGAMSGVLDVETQDPMNLRTVTAGANLAGYSAAATWALVPDKLSGLVTMQQSFPELLMRLYGSASDYTQYPWSENGAAKLLYRYSPTGRLSLFGIGSTEHIAVEANVLDVRDTYAANTRTAFGALHLQDALFGRGAVRATLSSQHYRDAWTYAAFGRRIREHTAQGDLDLTWPLGRDHELSLGAVMHRRAREDEGDAPADSTDLLPGAPSRPLADHVVTSDPGFYAEDKMRLVGPLYATLGARLDRAHRADEWEADPRAALAWRLDEHQTLRVAAGRYHQPADPVYTDARYGNPALRSPFADHVIAGYEWKSDYGNVRIEAYRKRYRGLPLVDSTTWYRADGTGRARGIDVFVQGTWREVNGWVSYGLLDAKRRQLDDPAEVTESDAVRHSLTLVGQHRWSGRWQTGLRWTHTSGRPFTPVVGAVWDPAREVWHPVYGAHGSALMPAYDRMDLRLMRIFSLPRVQGMPASGACVAYLEAMNLLATDNVLRYVYNFDYSRRYPDFSYFSRRMLVAGFSLTW
jgi:hypothetical protein